MADLIACGILKAEIETLVRRNGWLLDTCFLCSSLHVHPDRLEVSLKKLLERSVEPPVVLYGVCALGMDQLVARFGAVRTEGQNCVEFLLGHETFEHELSEGSFFLLEDWARRWDFVTSKCFANADIRRAVFQESHSRVLAIRTPCSGDFSTEAERVSQDVGLPLCWLDVGLEHLEAVLASALRAREVSRAKP